MRRLLGFVLVAAFLFIALWHLAQAQVFLSSNATHFFGFGMSTPKIASPPDIGGSVFMSFWYNMNQRPTRGGQLFLAQNFGGLHVLEVGFVGDEERPFLEVDAIDNLGNCAHLSTGNDPTSPTTLDMSFDGRWHHVIISLFSDAVSESGAFKLFGRIALDGDIRVLDGSPTQDPNSGYIFSSWFWKGVASWVVGGSYTGDLAEFVVDLEDINTVTGDITDALVSQYRTPGGQAVGLGENCKNPTIGNVVPVMCHRGAPCDFVNGVDFGMGPTYVLQPPVGLSLGGTYSSARTDPCAFTLNPPTIDSGKGCPSSSTSF